MLSTRGFWYEPARPHLAIVGWLLALAGVAVPISAAIPDLTDEHALRNHLRSKTSEYKLLRHQLATETFASEAQRAGIAERAEELARAALPPEVLVGLAESRYGEEMMEELARAAYLLSHLPALPALRRAAEKASGELRKVIDAALCTLGDREYLKTFYAEDWELLADRFLAEFDGFTGPIMEQIVAKCGEAELAERTDRTAFVVADGTPFVPYSRIFYRGDRNLMGGEVVKVLADGKNGMEGRALIIAHGEIGWIETALLHEGPLPGVEELTEDARRRWRSGDNKALLRPLQMLRYLHGTDLASLDLPMPAAVAEALTEILPVATRGTGESFSRREIVDLVIEQMLGDSMPEIRLSTRTGGWEGWGETLEILHGIGEGPSVRRFAVKTLEDDLESVFRRFPHIVDLDEDPDLELVVLEGTLSCAPEDNARTWKLRLYDFDGRRFSEVAWIPALKDFLRQRLEEAEDPLEKTILRSHFGVTASRNGEEVSVP